MGKKEIIKKVTIYADLVRKRYPARMIILYGSSLKGTRRKDSDIDVAVVVDKIEGDLLTLESGLYKLRREVDERIEPVLLEKGNDNSGFLEEILKDGEIVYQG